MTFFGDVMAIMSLKRLHNLFFGVRFRHNQLKNHNWLNYVISTHQNCRLRGAGGGEPPALRFFENLLL